MSHRLGTIRDEQSHPLNQIENAEARQQTFKSFAENPTHKIHPELTAMIRERLANQTQTIKSLEQKQSMSQLSSHNVMPPDTL